METHHPTRRTTRSLRIVAAAAALFGATLAMGAIDALASSSPASHRPPRPVPPTTTTTIPPATLPPAPVTPLGPTGPALAGFEFPITVDITQASAQFVVPRPTCATPGEQAVAFGLGGRAAAPSPADTAVVIVGCHGANAPFALMRARVGAFEVTRAIAFGSRVIVERTASGGNATTTVEDRDFPSTLVGARRILAIGGTRDTTVTFGAFGVLGANAVVLDVPRFAPVTFGPNLLDRAAVPTGTRISAQGSSVTATSVSATGDIIVSNRADQGG